MSRTSSPVVIRSAVMLRPMKVTSAPVVLTAFLSGIIPIVSSFVSRIFLIGFGEAMLALAGHRNQNTLDRGKTLDERIGICHREITKRLSIRSDQVSGRDVRLADYCESSIHETLLRKLTAMHVCQSRVFQTGLPG